MFAAHAAEMERIIIKPGRKILFHPGLFQDEKIYFQEISKLVQIS